MMPIVYVWVCFAYVETQKAVSDQLCGSLILKEDRRQWVQLDRINSDIIFPLSTLGMCPEARNYLGPEFLSVLDFKKKPYFSQGISNAFEISTLVPMIFCISQQ